jgi:hypothetical protein
LPAVARRWWEGATESSLEFLVFTNVFSTVSGGGHHGRRSQANWPLPDADKSFKIIMKEGVIYKKTL